MNELLFLHSVKASSAQRFHKAMDKYGCNSVAHWHCTEPSEVLGLLVPTPWVEYYSSVHCSLQVFVLSMQPK